MRQMIKRAAIEEKEAKRRSRMVKADVDFGRMATVTSTKPRKAKPTRIKPIIKQSNQLSTIEG